MKCGTKVSKKQNQIGEFSKTITCIIEMLKGRGAYKAVQEFLASNNINVSIGAIVRWAKDNIPEYVGEHTNYGKGSRVKVGRVLRTEFICKSTGENYVKLAEKWVREYTSIMSEMINEENNSDWVVHHVDGNHLNNDKKNLKIMSRSEHSKYHTTQYWKKIKEEIK